MNFFYFILLYFGSLASFPSQYYNMLLYSFAKWLHFGDILIFLYYLGRTIHKTRIIYHLILILGALFIFEQ